MKELASKASVGETRPWVRIPPSPPYLNKIFDRYWLATPSPARKSGTIDGDGCLSSTACSDCRVRDPVFLAENQLCGAAPNHVGRCICSRPRDDLWHYGGVRHAQAQNAVHAKLWVDNSELVHANFACTNCVPKTRRGKSGKFLDLLGARLGPWNEFALAQIVEDEIIDFPMGFSEKAVIVLPSILWRNNGEHVPMLCNSAVFDPKKIVVCGGRFGA